MPDRPSIMFERCPHTSVRCGAVTTILLVHDTRPRRRVIRALLEGYDDWTVIESTSNEVEEEVRERPSVLVVELAESSGIDGPTFEDLVERHPWLPAIVISRAVDEAAIVRAWDRGATLLPADELELGLAGAVHRAALRGGGRDPLSEHLSERRLRYELPNDGLLVTAVADDLAHLARPWIVDPVEGYRLRTALVGLIESALYDGNLEVAAAMAENPGLDPHAVAVDRVGRQPYVGRRIHIEARVDAGRSVFEVEHEGPAFDLASIDDGRTLAYLRAVADDVKFDPRSSVVTLIKKNPRVRRSAATVSQPAVAPPARTSVAPKSVSAESDVEVEEDAGNSSDPSKSQRRRILSIEELIGDVIPSVGSDPDLDLDDESGVTGDSGASEPEPKPNPKPKARIDRDVTDLLGQAPRVDGFGNPIDE